MSKTRVKTQEWSIEAATIKVVDTFADARDRDILNLAEEMEQDMEADKRRPICLPEICFWCCYNFVFHGMVLVGSSAEPGVLLFWKENVFKMLTSPKPRSY